MSIRCERKALSPLWRWSFRRGRSNKGFTLTEVIIAMAILTMISVSIITGTLMARSLAEYDKQRIAAIAAARSFVEELTRHNLYPSLSSIDDVTLDNFNTPDESDDLRASVSVSMYAVNSDGARGAELTSNPTNPDRIEVEVAVSWNRSGRMSSHRVTEKIQVYVSPDL